MTAVEVVEARLAALREQHREWLGQASGRPWDDCEGLKTSVWRSVDLSWRWRIADHEFLVAELRELAAGAPVGVGS